MRKIAGWPDYGICEKGFVWRLTSNGSTALLEKPRRLKSSARDDGRLHVTLHAHGKRHTELVNTLVCRTYHGEKLQGDLHAAHENGNYKDNAPKNLSWKTRHENELDKIRHGTLRAGSRVPGAKIKESDIPAIMLLQTKLSSRKVAKIYGVSDAAIRHIWQGRCWVRETMDFLARQAQLS